MGAPQVAVVKTGSGSRWSYRYVNENCAERKNQWQGIHSGRGTLSWWAEDLSLFNKVSSGAFSSRENCVELKKLIDGCGWGIAQGPREVTHQREHLMMMMMMMMSTWWWWWWWAPDVDDDDVCVCVCVWWGCVGTNDHVWGEMPPAFPRGQRKALEAALFWELCTQHLGVELLSLEGRWCQHPEVVSKRRRRPPEGAGWEGVASHGNDPVDSAAPAAARFYKVKATAWTCMGRAFVSFPDCQLMRKD